MMESIEVKALRRKSTLDMFQFLAGEILVLRELGNQQIHRDLRNTWLFIRMPRKTAGLECSPSTSVGKETCLLLWSTEGVSSSLCSTIVMLRRIYRMK